MGLSVLLAQNTVSVNLPWRPLCCRPPPIPTAGVGAPGSHSRRLTKGAQQDCASGAAPISHHNPPREDCPSTEGTKAQQSHVTGPGSDLGSTRALPEPSSAPSSAHLWGLGSPGAPQVIRGGGGGGGCGLRWGLRVHLQPPSSPCLSVAVLILDLPTPHFCQPSLGGEPRGIISRA